MKARKELAIALGILAFCLLNWLYLIPSQVLEEGSSTVYPHLLNSILAMFGLAYAVEAFRQMQKEEKTVKKKGPSFIAAYGRTLLLILATAIWLFSMEAAGFILSTVLFLIAASYIFGAKSLWKPLALSLVMPFLFYGVFRGLNSMLPQGPVEVVLDKLLG